MAELGTVSGQIRLDIRQAVAAYAAIRAQNQRTVYALRGTGDSFVQAGQTMGVAGAGMVWVFAKVVKAAADFERKMDFFSAVSGTNAESMAKLSDFTLQLAEDTIYSAEQIADGMIELGKAGVSADQIMGGIGEAMANLGAAGDIPLAESGQIITSTIQQFDMAAQDAVKVTDLLAGAANASIADITDLGVSLKYAGGVANAAGLDFEDTLVAISLLAKAGIRGSTAGTSLRQMMVSFGGATKPARAALKDLGILTYDLGDANKALADIMGGPAQKSVEGVQDQLAKYVESIDGGTVGTNKNMEAVNDLLMKYGGLNNQFYDSEGRLKKMSQVFQILQDSLKGYDNRTRLAYLRTLFNNRALSAAAILTRDGAKGFKDMNREMSKTTAADVASERLDNLSGDIEILQGNIETLMTKAGGPFQETLRGWVQNLTKLIQAFDELDPGTQKAIVQFIGIAGVSLVAMGAISIVIGTIARFIAAALKMAAGLKFLWRMIRVVVTNLKWFRAVLIGPLITALGAVSLPVWLIVGAIVALGAALYGAYRYFKPFRDMVNELIDLMGRGFDATWKFIQLLVTDPGAAWDATVQAFQDLVDDIEDAVNSLPGIMADAFDRAVQEVTDFAGEVQQGFYDLRDQVISTVTGFVNRVIDLFTFRNIGYALGFLAGMVTRGFVMLGTQMFALAARAVAGVLNFFARLPAQVGYFIGFMIGAAVGGMIRLGVGLFTHAARIVNGVTNFFQMLPARIGVFLTQLVANATDRFVAMAIALPGQAQRIYNGVVNWFQQLPGRILGFILRMAVAIPRELGELQADMLSMAQGMYDGFVNAMQGLPGEVDRIVDNMIQAVQDAAGDAFEAVQEFAAGMWDGFRDGLGIHSPSYIEEAMWQITGVLDTETKKIAKRTMDVQRLSKKMASTQFGVGGSNPDALAPKGYAGLASMHARNQNRARTLQDSVRNRRDIASKGATTKVITRDVTVNNPKPERAGQSVAKQVRNKAEEAGYR